MPIFENVKSIAEKRGMSISALEKAAGLGNGVIGAWRTCTPNVNSLKSVADVLHVKVDKLLN